MAGQRSSVSKHEQANGCYINGDFDRAVALQVEVVNEEIKSGGRARQARKLLALYLFHSGEFDAAHTTLRFLAREFPEDSEIPETMGFMMQQSGRHLRAVEYLLEAHRLAPGDIPVCDLLTQCFHTLRKADEVRHFGEMSLALKALSVMGNRGWPVPPGMPPVFDPRETERNVISFSLVGDDPRFLNGALRNARLSPDLYPDWTCRFYCDAGVPRAIIRDLKGLGAQVVQRPAAESVEEGLLWRLEVIDDPMIDRFLIRDCDAVINVRERVAVDEWLDSEKWFHVMRDHPTQTDLLPGGLWGGVSGVFPSARELREAHSRENGEDSGGERSFLREMIWPTIRENVLIHDSAYTGCFGSVPFPRVGGLPRHRHVGQRETVLASSPSIPPVIIEPDSPGKFFVFGYHPVETSLLRHLLGAHPEVHCHPDRHLGTLWREAGSQVAKQKRILGPEEGEGLNFPRIREELYRSWLKNFFSDYPGEAVTRVGLCDHQLDANLALHGEMLPGSKFLFVVRDPRQVAVSVWETRKGTEPGFDRDGTRLNEVADAVGTEWVNKLNRIQEFNGTCPGRIELVRYEDLMSPEVRPRALRRVLKFLGLPVSDAILEEMESIHRQAGPISPALSELPWEDALSLGQVEMIQDQASRLMELLRYEIWPVDCRFLDMDDTILPS